MHTHSLQLFEAILQLLLGPPAFLEMLHRQMETLVEVRTGPSASAGGGERLTIFLSCFISCEYLASSRHTRMPRLSATSSRWPAKSLTSWRSWTNDCCWLNLVEGDKQGSGPEPGKREPAWHRDTGLSSQGRAGGWGVRGQPRLHCKLEASLGYVRP